ncbi:transposase [Streptosporangium pseudovulgare]|uniref:HTH cro/C1-type domain-containing protein n=1 Tax=Streptosporangium pseudovulgare TaxID=35765 RepID=A0ABQ2RL82_9ACTN|nr:transposase [Streptosporangium pseudovulgare]GGQ32235.1 hypothetical protein GCM10010140_72920 [Streptosporangium pseudovulgare]
MSQHALRRAAGDPDPLLLSLLQRRITCGRTPAQVADAMGVNVQSVYELERKIRAGRGVLLGTACSYAAAVGALLIDSTTPTSSRRPGPNPSSRSAPTATASSSRAAAATGCAAAAGCACERPAAFRRYHRAPDRRPGAGTAAPPRATSRPPRPRWRHEPTNNHGGGHRRARVDQLKTGGHEIRDEDIARLSPRKHRNLNLIGRYSFTASTPAAGALGIKPAYGLPPAARSAELTRTYVTAFLDQHLKSQRQPLLNKLSSRYPEVKFCPATCGQS